MTIRNYLSCMAERFSLADIDGAIFEARVLLCHVLSISSTELLIRNAQELSHEEILKLDELSQRRLNGEPLQYIIGSWDFMGNTFSVGDGVLIPRPETEELCEKASEFIALREKPMVFDLCSGSGCIGLSLKKLHRNADVYLIEKSEAALSFLFKNAEAVCPGESLTVIKGDVLKLSSFDFLPQADFIISNPPYIRKDELPFLQKEVGFEPVMALDGGEDGLIFYDYIIKNWSAKLKKDGYFVFEIGEAQAEQIGAILQSGGFVCKTFKDLSGNDRIITARRSGYDI